MKVLVFTTLYPNAAAPENGVFVENRLRHLMSGSDISVRVVAPVPWFPIPGARFGAYSVFARAPHAETRHGIAVDHPRFPVIPKVGMLLAPFLLYVWTRRHVDRLRRLGFSFDLIDAHYAYPDGVAAAMLGRRYGCPVVITARGTDVNVIAGLALPRRLIRWAMTRAAAVVSVSDALRQRIAEIGIDGAKTVTLRNGVELTRFRPVDRAAARQRFGVTGPVIVAVGNLIPAKGQRIVVEAMSQLPGVTLLIAGGGPDEAALRKLVAREGVASRVRLLGRVAHDELPDLYGAADISVLASAREGWPNVLLESMACGTPVVATDVGGVREIVRAPEAGTVIAERTPAAVADAVRALLAGPPDRAATRKYAEGFSWDATTQGQVALFEKILGRGATT